MWRDFKMLFKTKASWCGTAVIFLNLLDVLLTVYILEMFPASGSREFNPFVAALYSSSRLFILTKLAIPLLFVLYFESQRKRYPVKTKIIFGAVFAIYLISTLYHLAGIYVLSALHY